MPYSEVHATATATGANFSSKAALKRAYDADPKSVWFESVSPMGPQFCGSVESPEDLPGGLKLTPVGPDPFRVRSWYGTVEVKNGKIKIS